MTNNYYQKTTKKSFGKNHVKNMKIFSEEKRPKKVIKF